MYKQKKKKEKGSGKRKKEKLLNETISRLFEDSRYLVFHGLRHRESPINLGNLGKLVLKKML